MTHKVSLNPNIGQQQVDQAESYIVVLNRISGIDHPDLFRNVIVQIRAQLRNGDLTLGEILRAAAKDVTANHKAQKKRLDALKDGLVALEDYARLYDPTPTEDDA